MANPKEHYNISAPALHTARILFRNFEFLERPGSRVRATEKNVSIIVDIGTNIFRAQNAMTQLVTQVQWADKNELIRNVSKLQELIRCLEVANNRLGSFNMNESRTTIAHHEMVERELTRAEIVNAEMVGKALKSARTVAEEQRVLQQAGLIGAR